AGGGGAGARARGAPARHGMGRPRSQSPDSLPPLHAQRCAVRRVLVGRFTAVGRGSATSCPCASPAPPRPHKGRFFAEVWHGLGGRRSGSESARRVAAGRRAQRVEVATSTVPLPGKALAPWSPPRVAHLVPATSEAEPLANNLPLNGWGD